MNKLKYIIVSIIAIVLAVGCNDDTEPYSTHPVPSDWFIENAAALPSSFTAIVALPDNLEQYSGDSDMLAAFINGKCRGVGNLVTSDDNSKRVYYLTVRASDTEDGEIGFKYYNAKLSYLYRATQTIKFEIDGTYGTYDSPIVLDLEYVE